MWRASHTAVLALAVATALLAGFGAGVTLRPAGGAPAVCPLRGEGFAQPASPTPDRVAVVSGPAVACSPGGSCPRSVR